MIDKYQIGLDGERVVMAYYSQLGKKVEKSSDEYDSVKDMTIDGIKTEVKTQTLYRAFPSVGGVTQPAFTVDIATDVGKIYSNQLNKCMNVEKLIFVRRSSSNDPYVRIYEAPKLGKRMFSIIKNKKDGRYVAGFLLKDMDEIAAIDKPNIVKHFMDDYRSNN